jgi:hypothetical protein
MTLREFRELKEEDLKHIADSISKLITIRSYEDGNSRDDTRETTRFERDIIWKIAYAALISYGYRSDGSVDSILDMAEFTLMRFLPEANTYDTIYIPLKKAMGLW